MNLSTTHALPASPLPLAVGDPMRSLPTAWLDPADAEDTFAQADLADSALLRLVGCAAAATLVLALATSLGA